MCEGKNNFDNAINEHCKYVEFCHKNGYSIQDEEAYTMFCRNKKIDEIVNKEGDKS